MPRDGSNNLVSISSRTIEEQQHIHRLGGIKSGEARRKKKALKETLQMILDLKPNDPRLKKKMEEYKVKKGDQTNQTAMLLNLVERAMKNTDDLDKVVDIMGEKFLPQQDVNVAINSNTAQTTNAFLSAVQERTNSFDEGVDE